MSDHYPLGAKPGRNDPNDYRFADALAAVPPAGMPTYKMWDAPIVLDQGDYGTCVANAWTLLLMAAPFQHQDKKLLDYDNQPRKNQGSSRYWPDGWHEDPIAAELYALRLYDRIHTAYEPPDPDRQAGCQTENGGKVLRDRGLVQSWYRARSVDEVVTAILTTSPVVFASPWYRSMFGTTKDPTTGQHWVDFDPRTGVIGYHAYLLDVANTEEGWVAIHNSWSDGWGRQGRARISIDDLNVLFWGQAFIATEVA